MIQPATRTGLRPYRSDRVPAKKLVAALTMPNAAMKVSVAVKAVSPNSSSASSGRTVRSWPIMPPTSALTPTSSENWARFCAQPQTDRVGVTFVWVTVRSRDRHRLCYSTCRVHRQNTDTSLSLVVRMLAAVMPVPHGHTSR